MPAEQHIDYAALRIEKQLAKARGIPHHSQETTSFITPDTFISRAEVGGFHLCLDCPNCEIPEDAFGLEILPNHLLFHISMIDTSVIDPYSREAFRAYHRGENTYKKGKFTRIFPEIEKQLCYRVGESRPTVTMTLPYDNYHGFQFPYFWLTQVNIDRRISYPEAEFVIADDPSSNGIVLRAYSWLSGILRTRRLQLQRQPDNSRSINLHDYYGENNVTTFWSNHGYVRASLIVAEIKGYLNACWGNYITQDIKVDDDSYNRPGVVCRRHTGEQGSPAFNSGEVGPHVILGEDAYSKNTGLRNSHAFVNVRTMTDRLKGAEPVFQRQDVHALFGI